MLKLTIVCCMILGTVFSAPHKSHNHDVTKICMKGAHHKPEPGPEQDLAGACKPWTDRSCCTNETSYFLQHTSLEERCYNFNYDHCAHVKPMSPKCRHKFEQEDCFHECSPNLGPWIVKVKTANFLTERLYKIPLCEHECMSWFDACVDDYTCNKDWSIGWDWSSGANLCGNGKKCEKVSDLYKDHIEFCETVYKGEFKVVADEEPCLVLSFKGNKNPNDQVARYFASKLNVKRDRHQNKQRK